MRLRALVGTMLFSLSLVGCGSQGARTADDAALPLPREARLLPARIRRLTNLELERSIAALTGRLESITTTLPPDVRKEGFTPNADQDVPSGWAVRYSALVREIARRAARERLDELAPCGGDQGGCAAKVVDRLGPRAYRRPLRPSERKLLLEAYDEGARDGGGRSGGTELMLRVLLESPSFLYVTELGEGGKPSEIVTLEPHEIASALSYMLRGAPPDQELSNAAEAGELASPARRAFHARRLLGMSETRAQFQRFVLEWLEVDGLERTAKSARLYPDYEFLKPRMLAETRAFVDEVMVNAGASARALLGAGFASVDPEMARFYGLKAYGPRARLAGSGRLGLLQQASFLAAHAHEDVSSPLKRGDFVMRKLLCQKVARPGEIGIETVMPAPSSATTTRERFAAHAFDEGCAACHQRLDAFGFTFEGFDAMGAARTSENGRPVVTSARVTIGDQTLEVANSVDLVRRLSESPVVSECFARHAFRYFSAEHDSAIEQSFLELRQQLPSELRENLLESLIAYVRSDLFVKRQVRP